MILEFQEGKKRMQKNLKSELFSASYASGVILRKQARKLRRMRMNAQLVGFLKSEPKPLEDLKFVKSCNLTETLIFPTFFKM